MVWRDLALRGITQSSGIFGSMLYGFTWIHIAHVLVGILLILWLGFKFLKINSVQPKDQLRVKNVGMFWHFLGLVWLVMFLGLFVF
jgi:cytochrome c oxidase subunit 3